jgi:DNA-binding NarL/FixJ family response regulator
MIRVLLVSDRPAIRAGLAQVIDSEPGFRADVAAPDTELAAAAGAHVALIDFPLAATDASEVCRAVRRVPASPQVALYSDRTQAEAGIAARVMGADAIVDKDASVPSLFEQLRRLARGALARESAGTRGRSAA